MADPGEENRSTPFPEGLDPQLPGSYWSFWFLDTSTNEEEDCYFTPSRSSQLLCDMPYESHPGSPKNLQKDMADTNAVIRLIRRYIEK